MSLLTAAAWVSNDASLAGEMPCLFDDERGRRLCKSKLACTGLKDLRSKQEHRKVASSLCSLSYCDLGGALLASGSKGIVSEGAQVAQHILIPCPVLQQHALARMFDSLQVQELKSELCSDLSTTARKVRHVLHFRLQDRFTSGTICHC